MVYFPVCKINIGLHVLSRRADGYHDIETLFYPVNWTDIMEIIPARDFNFSVSGMNIPGIPEDNICVKAYGMLKRDFDIPPVQLYLHKLIPPGTGLGGGSSDAAFTLKSINNLYSLGMELAQLKAYAAELGSDCPFFLEPSAMLGSGKGDILEPAPIDLHGKFLVIIIPNIHISTAGAYAAVKPVKTAITLPEIFKRPVSAWRDHLHNDFETSVFLKYPEIAEIKDKIYALGAVYASMSGSGSSVFGLFDHPVDLKDNFSGMQCWSGELT
jgi:4-diphosphocytidyl-2-C-methyl-D-erythritol kinase